MSCSFKSLMFISCFFALSFIFTQFDVEARGRGAYGGERAAWGGNGGWWGDTRGDWYGNYGMTEYDHPYYGGRYTPYQLDYGYNDWNDYYYNNNYPYYGQEFNSVDGAGLYIHTR